MIVLFFINNVLNSLFILYICNVNVLLTNNSVLKMNNISSRIKELRVKNKFTQSDLAKLVGLTYIQIGRYETSKSNPSSDVLLKLANALNTTTDYLMNGSTDEKISTQLTDKQLLEQFKKVEKLNKEDKHLVKTFIDAFLTKRQIQTLAL